MKYDLASTPTVREILDAPKAALYLRVSSPNQLKKGDGLNSQEAICREFAEREGYEVEAVFRDNVTGGINDRPAMDALLAYMKKRKKKGLVIIVDDLDRFSRETRLYWELRARVAEAGGKLLSPGEDFGDDADSKLRQNIKVAVAQHFREKNAERTYDRMRGRLLNGFWPFIPPRGMRQQKVPGKGLVLTRLEPEASVIAEGLQAFADGRLRTQAEFARWLDAHPHFSKGRRKHITNQQAYDLLTNVLYAGMVGRPEWDVDLRPGQHEGLITFEAFEKIQRRLKAGSYAPARSDLSADFPLRGAVSCAQCGKPLTACWSKSKTGARHAYYMCYNRDCARNRKSIRAAQLETDFVALLDAVTPRPQLVTVAGAMFKSAWQQRTAQATAAANHYRLEIKKTETQIARLLDRIMESTTSSVITAFETRIAELERTKLVLEEKASTSGATRGTFEELFELAIDFLANPSKLWRFGTLEHRKTVLRLVFSEAPSYAPEEGFRTPKTTMPFSMLGDNRRPFDGMAERKGFEPSRRFPVCTLSRGVPSTTRPPLRRAS